MNENDRTHVVIFSGRDGLGIAEALQTRLQSEGFATETWRDGMFTALHVPSLQTFLRKLHGFDAGIIVLTADDVIESASSAVPAVYRARENVMIEVGAVLARMGRNRTFIVLSDDSSRRIQLPSYLNEDNVYRCYGHPDDPILSRISGPARNITSRLQAINRDFYSSDLPAAGLAYGYCANFLYPCIDALLGPGIRELIPGITSDNMQSYFFRVSICVPGPELLGTTRSNAEAFLRHHNFTPRAIPGQDARPISLYWRNENGQVHVADVPTTLGTSELLINALNTHYGHDTDNPLDRLRSREQRNFCRTIRTALNAR